jgi:hypothetical protein
VNKREEVRARMRERERERKGTSRDVSEDVGRGGPHFVEKRIHITDRGLSVSLKITVHQRNNCSKHRRRT